MIATDGIYLELHAADTELLAGFYERLFGFERVESSTAGALLARNGVLLRIKVAVDEPAGDASIVFGFQLSTSVDLAACQSEAVAAGAIVLSESKRGAVRTIMCQDPSGNEFVLVGTTSAATIAPNESLVPVAARPVGSVEPPPQAAGARPTPPLAGRVSRRDVDQLRDKERLAAMQETIAGLHVPFSSDDPASAIADMSAKLGPASTIDSKVAEADAQMRAREREAAVQDMLERYRKETLGETVEAPSPGSPAPAVDDDAPMSPRTLGRSNRSDEPDDE